jgi:hypothetical protein
MMAKRKFPPLMAVVWDHPTSILEGCYRCRPVDDLEGLEEANWTRPVAIYKLQKVQKLVNRTKLV